MKGYNELRKVSGKTLYISPRRISEDTRKILCSKCAAPVIVDESTATIAPHPSDEPGCSAPKLEKVNHQSPPTSSEDDSSEGSLIETILSPIKRQTKEKQTSASLCLSTNQTTVNGNNQEDVSTEKTQFVTNQDVQTTSDARDEIANIPLPRHEHNMTDKNSTADVVPTAQYTGTIYTEDYQRKQLHWHHS